MNAFGQNHSRRDLREQYRPLFSLGQRLGTMPRHHSHRLGVKERAAPALNGLHPLPLPALALGEGCRDRQQSRQPWNVFPPQAIRVTSPIEPLVVGANHQSHVGEVMDEPGQLLAQNRMLLHQCPFGFIQGRRGGLRELNDSARNADQSDIVEQRAQLEHLPLLRRHFQALRHRFAHLQRAPGLGSEAGIKRLQNLQAEFDRAVEVALQGVIQSPELAVLFSLTSHLRRQAASQLRQLAVHRHGGAVQLRVTSDQLIPLDAVFDGD